MHACYENCVIYQTFIYLHFVSCLLFIPFIQTWNKCLIARSLFYGVISIMLLDIILAQVVQRLDSAIQHMYHYPLDRYTAAKAVGLSSGW